MYMANSEMRRKKINDPARRVIIAPENVLTRKSSSVLGYASNVRSEFNIDDIFQLRLWRAVSVESVES